MHGNMHLLTLPEQLAIAEVQSLLQKGKIEIVNFVSFSIIDSTPLKIVEIPFEECTRFGIHDPDTSYLGSTVTLYCRGERIAEVVIEIAATFETAIGLSYFSRVAQVRARKYFWRNDPEEQRDLIEFNPEYTRYFGIKWSTDEIENMFLIDIANAITNSVSVSRR